MIRALSIGLMFLLTCPAFAESMTALVQFNVPEGKVSYGFRGRVETGEVYNWLDSVDKGTKTIAIGGTVDWHTSHSLAYNRPTPFSLWQPTHFYHTTLSVGTQTYCSYTLTGTHFSGNGEDSGNLISGVCEDECYDLPGGN